MVVSKQNIEKIVTTKPPIKVATPDTGFGGPIIIALLIGLFFMVLR